MQYIDIFLASSITDMHNERMELGNYIRTLNDMYQSRGIYFRLHMCEDISDEVAAGRSQDVYNDVIRDCDYFYIMFWQKAGQYTIEEFDVALNQFRETGKTPKISTFFKKTDEPGEDVKAFMDRLDKDLQHYYTMFDSIDSVKLKILLEMAQRPELQAQVTLQDSKIMLNGEELRDLHTDNLPIYANHERINELRKQAEKLGQDLINARLKISEKPDDNDLWQELYKISAEKNKAEEELHDLEMELIKLASRVVEMSADGEYLTQRAKKAIELFDQGRAEEALIVLDDEERRKDAERALEMAKETKNQLLACVKECELKIDGLKAQGVTQLIAEGIISLYEEIESYVREGGLDRGYIIDYMNFLGEQKHYQEAIKKGEQLYHYFKSEGTLNEEVWSRFCNNLANLYNNTRRYEKAELLCIEALEIRRRLAGSNPQAYESDVAMTCNNLANLYNNTRRYEKAELLYIEALEILRRLAGSNPQAYEPNVAMTCNNLADLYNDTKRYEKAEQLYIAALEIYRRLAGSNPQTYEPDVAMTCNNLAILYNNTRRYEKADLLYVEALEIYRRLAGSNPQAYEPNVAMTCNNLAILYNNTRRYEKAEQLYVETLEIYRKLAGSDPQAYEPDMATTCNNLANLYRDSSLFEDAEPLYVEVLEIRRRLAESDPRTYELALASTCNDLANLYSYMNRYEESEPLYIEALEIYRRLAGSDPQAYEPDVATTCNNLAALYDDTKRYEKAEQLCIEALEIRRRLAGSDPQAYESALAITLFSLYLLYGDSGKTEEADRYKAEALEIAEKYKDSDPICQQICDRLTDDQE